MAKDRLDRHNQRPASADDANLTPISTKEVENKDEMLLQLFYSTKNIYSYLTGKFTVLSYRGNNYILVALQ